MENITSQVSLTISSCSYLKNPESSELGKKIISGSIELIDAHGFENFNFKKLATHIESTEASIYRYFENKHKVLLYLSSWYWSWLDYKLAMTILNISSPNERLSRCLDVLTAIKERDLNFPHVDEEKLNRIIVMESSKSYLTKEVDIENKEGAFSAYKSMVARVSGIIEEINPDFKYSKMLVTTVIEGVHHQHFFADHLPGLTTIIDGEDSISNFYKLFVFSIITNKTI
jgi:AcrR family transcriptional regulator